MIVDSDVVSMAVSIVVKATVIAAAGLAGAGLARGSRAAVRHAVLSASFAVMLGLPVASMVVPPVRVAVPVAPTVFVEAVDAGPQVASSSMPAAMPSAVPHSTWPSAGTLLLTGWFAGAVFFLLRMVVGLWQVHSLRRYGLPWRDGQEVVDRLALDAGIRRRVDVLLHESLPAPVTCGVIRPAIVLPPDAQNWAASDLNRALVHELEHVRRADWVVHCLARVVCAAYWFHPLVWMVWRRLALEAERACDDAVLSGSEATLYADQLVGLARRLSANRKSPALAMASRSDLSARVGAVLDSGRRRGRAGKVLVASVCTVATLVLVAISPLRMIAAPQSIADQAPASEPLAFDVAVIKPSPPLEQQKMLHVGVAIDKTRVDMGYQSLQELIVRAYRVSVYQIAGPEWIASVRFDIDAKLPEGATQQQVPEMLQALLADRFKLAIHRQIRPTRVFDLVIGKGGSKLQMVDESVPVAPPQRISSGLTEMEARGSMPDLANLLSRFAGRPVFDKTGLAGKFRVVMDLPLVPAGEAATAEDESGSIFTSVERLGLKLDSQTEAVETIVIDHLERLPTEN